MLHQLKVVLHANPRRLEFFIVLRFHLDVGFIPKTFHFIIMIIETKDSRAEDWFALIVSLLEICSD
jgi:hypothetical protein